MPKVSIIVLVYNAKNIYRSVRRAYRFSACIQESISVRRKVHCGDRQKTTAYGFTPTYNRGHLIHQIYESLLAQDYYNFEWLVIDDGSQDQTQSLFDTWLKKDNPFEIRYYRQENQGLIRTLNRGIALSKGQYFSKIDSDDYVVPDYAKTSANGQALLKTKMIFMRFRESE